jgi:antitoxin ParD1/3/4
MHNHAHKLSISLPSQQYKFIENYKTAHHFQTRSEVIKEALYLLQQKHLESCYSEASKEVDHAFEITNADGIEENETW